MSTAVGCGHCCGWFVLDTKLPRGTSQEITQAIRPFTERELDTVLTAVRPEQPQYADLIEFAALTGLRWGELAALRVDAVAEVPYPVVLVDRSLSDGYTVKTTKGRRARRVPLVPRAVEILQELTAGRAHDALIFTAPRADKSAIPRSLALSAGRNSRLTVP